MAVCVIVNRRVSAWLGSGGELFTDQDGGRVPQAVIRLGDGAAEPAHRRARINMIAHLLSTVPYYELQRPPLRLPPRPMAGAYQRPPLETTTYVPDHAATLLTQA